MAYLPASTVKRTPQAQTHQFRRFGFSLRGVSGKLAEDTHQLIETTDKYYVKNTPKSRTPWNSPISAFR
jgi:hypothetical protein